MKEIEVKILEIEVEDIRKKLLALGAEKIFDGELNIINFDYSDQRLIKEKKVLRLRKVGKEVELCFKGKKENSQFKTQEEIEVNTSAFKDTLAILEKIGLKIIYRGKKHRESYKLGKIRFEIDTYPKIPTYLEIEAPTEEEVKTTVEQLGYQMEQTTNLDARQLEEHYQNETKTT